MKSPSYVYGVTKIYRRLLDENRSARKAEIFELARLFSRGGFTDGYFTRQIGGEMLGVRSEKDISDTRGALTFHSDKGRNADAAKPKTVAETEKQTITLPDKLEFPPKTPFRKPTVTARFRSASQIPDNCSLDHIYLPLSKYESLADGVILPPVIFDDEAYETKRKLEKAVEKGAKHIMLCNIGQLGLAKQFGLIPHGDFRLNVFNSFSAAITPKPKILIVFFCHASLPCRRSEIFILNPIQEKRSLSMDVFRSCFLKKPWEEICSAIPAAAVFPILPEDNRDILYNSVPVYMADQLDRLDKAGVEERHMIFSDESRGDVMKVLYAYSHGIIPKENIRRIK